VKAIVALLFLVSIVVITLHLTTKKQIGVLVAVLFFCVAILGGLAIANYDFIKTLKWNGLEIQTFRGEVDSIKGEALASIRAEVESQKASIRLLITNANDLRTALDAEKAAVESLLEKSKAAEQRLTSLDQHVSQVAAQIAESQRRVEELHKASDDLALLLAQITWLQIETKNEFGTERATAALNKIVDGLNRVVVVVIPEANARSRWIQQLTNSLPKGQGGK
jgi:hypothetical protein